MRYLVSKCTAERPIVAVIWVSPAHDKKRGKDGETVWVQFEAYWKVFVGDWGLAEGFDESHEPETTRIAGLEFWFCPVPDAPSLEGKTIDYLSGELVVR